MAIISAQGLRKRYGATEALRGVDLSIDEGEIFGILGPNGSGKTTAVETIGGLRRRDSGTIDVAGMDPASSSMALRDLLGMQLQQARLQPKLTTREAITLFGAFAKRPRPTDELLERFGLTDRANTRFEKLSGGQQQRLSVAIALVGSPRIAILDELTTGLDPRARRDIWDYLEHLRDDGTTIILVTHSMEEAQVLCDRVAVMTEGQVRAVDTPHALAARQSGYRLGFVPSRHIDVDELRRLDSVHDLRQEGERIEIVGSDASPQEVLVMLANRDITATRLRVTEPSLDDAYLRLTDATAGAATGAAASQETESR